MRRKGSFILALIMACTTIMSTFGNGQVNVNAQTVSEPETVTAEMKYEDIEQFPFSYREALYELKTKHPNWVFEMYDVGLEWDTVVFNELNPSSRSLLPSYFPSNMVGAYYGDNWSCATQEAVEYYLDPRNWLSEKYIFMFEVLTLNEEYQNFVTVQKVLDGTFMEGVIPGEESVTYAQLFYETGRNLGVSPIHLAARVRQEQGIYGTSDLISGNYPGYEGYYNFYNIEASGQTKQEIVTNGLKEAMKEGWYSRYLAIKGGSAKVAKNYILVGQDTLYLQKFDVDATSYGRYWHQYMQNLAAPSSEAVKIYNAYSEYGVLESSFVFKIPVYRDMPGDISYSVANGTYYICPAANTELTFDVAWASADPGANVGLWTNNEELWQQWNITRIDEGFYMITNVNSGHNLDSTEDHNVIQWEDNGADNQKWIIRENNDGTFTFISKYNERYISTDTAEQEIGEGINIVTKDRTGEIDQKFYIYTIEDMMPVRGNGWVTWNGSKYYFKNGVMCKDAVVNVEGSNYYLDTEGKLVVGQEVYVESKGITIKCQASGKLASGWVTVDGKKQYYDGVTGARVEGTRIISNKCYLFERGTGYLVSLKGEIYKDQISEEEYKLVYFNEDGEILIDELISVGPQEDKAIVMSGDDGYLFTGWVVGLKGEARNVEAPVKIEDREIRYFDTETGLLAFGEKEIDHRICTFNEVTGLLEELTIANPEYGWQELDGKFYWYEDYELQGSKLNEDGTVDLSYRGKEIYDPEKDAWFWLDNVDGGAMTTSKDVFQESAAGFMGEFVHEGDESGERYGKWVRYDADGYMIKGWCVGTAEEAKAIESPAEAKADQSLYYFDTVYGTMYKGHVQIGDVMYYFDVNTGVAYNGWLDIDGNKYWYEQGVRQGYRLNEDGTIDLSYRGKEIYDPGSDAWYWLDNVDSGKMAVSKDVFQESEAGQCGEWEGEDGKRYGKWVRYDENGHMVKGWNQNENGWFYFDEIYGTMCKGLVTIDGIDYYFDEVLGYLHE